jgi:hypothetical protein
MRRAVAEAPTMNARILRKIILTTLASSTLGSPSACDDGTPTTFANFADLLVSPLSRPDSSIPNRSAEAELTTINSFTGALAGDAAFLAVDASTSSVDASLLSGEASVLRDGTGVPFPIGDGGTYDEWIAAMVKQPCTQLCAELIPISGNSGTQIAVVDCDPASMEGSTLVVHCAWTDVSTVYDYGSTPDGCSLGRGRIPAGFVARAVPGSDARARFFASETQLEAASVTSFAILARDLARHRAPLRLIRAATRARRDEVLHTRVMSALARRYGATEVPRGTAPRWRPRTLESVATENVIEGCVRETYGALDATWIGENARDPRVRSAMAGIARDETRHAALSWQIAAWSSRVLGGGARKRIARAREAAVLELASELEASKSPALVEAGLTPPIAERRFLLASLERGLHGALPRCVVSS